MWQHLKHFQAKKQAEAVEASRKATEAAKLRLIEQREQKKLAAEAQARHRVQVCSTACNIHCANCGAACTIVCIAHYVTLLHSLHSETYYMLSCY